MLPYVSNNNNYYTKYKKKINVTILHKNKLYGNTLAKRIFVLLIDAYKILIYVIQ